MLYRRHGDTQTDHHGQFLSTGSVQGVFEELRPSQREQQQRLPGDPEPVVIGLRRA